MGAGGREGGIQQDGPFPRPRRRPPRAGGNRSTSSKTSRAGSLGTPNNEEGGLFDTWPSTPTDPAGAAGRRAAMSQSGQAPIAMREALSVRGPSRPPPAPPPADAARSPGPGWRTSSPPAPPGGAGARHASAGGRPLARPGRAAPAPGSRRLPRPAAPPPAPGALAAGRRPRGRGLAARGDPSGRRKEGPGGRARPLGRPGLGGGWPPARPLPVPLPTAPGTPGEGEAGFAGRGRGGRGGQPRAAAPGNPRRPRLTPPLPSP